MNIKPNLLAFFANFWTTVGVVLFVLYVIMFPVIMLQYRRFITILREQYPDQWKALGRPSAFWYTIRRRSQGKSPTWVFLRERGYRDLGDKELTRAANLVRIGLWVQGGGFLGFMFSILTAGVINHFR